MYWGIAADQMGWSLFGIAPGIAQPTLLLWGDRDHGMDMGRGVRRLHALMPASRLVVFPGAGHALAAERPAELAAHLIEFFSRH
jgi:pimeloyl-ACP methyl ester carboxylesterase